MRTYIDRPCEVCGQPFRTRKDTKTRFCGLECQLAGKRRGGWKLSVETRAKMSAAIKRRWQDPEQAAAFSRGHPPNENELRALSEGRTRPRSAETRARISAAVKRRWAEDDGRMRKRLAESRRTPEARAKMRRGRLNRTDFPRTDIEILLGDAMRSIGLEFEEQRPFMDRFIPDFTFTGSHLLVQADGEYWHRFERNRRFDRMLRDAIEGTPWRLLRFDAADIYADPAACARKVAAAL